MILKVLVTMGTIIVALIIISILHVFIVFDDVEEIDNSDGHIICGYTNEICIKDKLFTKCDN